MTDVYLTYTGDSCGIYDKVYTTLSSFGGQRQRAGTDLRSANLTFIWDYAKFKEKYGSFDKLSCNVWARSWYQVSTNGVCQLFSDSYSLDQPFKEVTMIDFPANGTVCEKSTKFEINLEQFEQVDKINFKFDGGNAWHTYDAWERYKF